MTGVSLTDSLMERSALYEAFSLLFRYPDEEVFELLKGRVATLDGICLDAKGGRSLEAFRSVVGGIDYSGYRNEYSRLFTGAGLCRTNENDYERLSFSMTERLADVAGFYKAFGFEMAYGAGERPDFIGAQLEFVRMLLLKQAYAQERGWAERAEITDGAVSEFLESHIVGWVPMMCQILVKMALEGGVFSAAATALQDFISAEGTRITVASEPPPA